jgi:hypothetical protein
MSKKQKEEAGIVETIEVIVNKKGVTQVLK